jgi:hypothetical protein
VALHLATNSGVSLGCGGGGGALQVAVGRGEGARVGGGGNAARSWLGCHSYAPPSLPGSEMGMTALR